MMHNWLLSYLILHSARNVIYAIRQISMTVTVEAFFNVTCMPTMNLCRLSERTTEILLCCLQNSENAGNLAFSAGAHIKALQCG
jgi:hypothetical protein